MKQFIPKAARLYYQLLKRYLYEHLLQRKAFATLLHPPLSFPLRIQQQQHIQMSAHFANKVHNLDLCIQAIDGLVLQPQQLFSFWQLVPKPSLKNGFKTGRNLVNGQVSEAIGGGICQVSCIIYMNALKAGLEIIERHTHSIDIYKEHERIAPLGSDATVVYGYKDLQFKNPHAFPIQIRLARQDQQLICCLYSQEALPNFDLDFKTEMLEQIKRVTTYADDTAIAQSQYKISD